MSTIPGAQAQELAPRRFGVRARLGAGFTAAIGAISGLAPHVLHHIGPIAGAALIGGAGGTALFAVIGFAVSVPFLLRLRRRFGTWRAPGIALLAFIVVFAFSSLVIGPAIQGDEAPASSVPAQQAPSGHLGHH